MKDLFEGTRNLVNYRQSVKGDVYESMYRAVDDLKINVNKYKTSTYDLMELIFVISGYKQIINKLSIVGLLSDSKWEVLSEALRELETKCHNLIDMNDEQEEGE